MHNENFVNKNVKLFCDEKVVRDVKLQNRNDYEKIVFILETGNKCSEKWYFYYFKKYLLLLEFEPNI